LYLYCSACQNNHLWKQSLKTYRKNPGVYRYYDKEGKLLYIGKAKNLKNRVSSYFVHKDHSYRIQLMVRKIHTVEYSIVPTEKDALLLENALIKGISTQIQHPVKRRQVISIH
jgi:excinuclease ABC subunit C